MSDSSEWMARGMEVTAKLWGERAGARNLGIGRDELIEVLMQTACYAGIPAAVNALNAAAEVLDA